MIGFAATAVLVSGMLGQFGGFEVIEEARPETIRALRGTGGRALIRLDQLPPEQNPDLPADAKEMLAGFNTEAAEIRKKAEEQVTERRRKLVEELQKAQDRYTREAKLDEAVAIRDTIRKLKSAHLSVRPDPGNLSEYRDHEGETFYFQVTGRTGSTIWGSDFYTGDSSLATAAVHAGAAQGKPAWWKCRSCPRRHST